MFIINEILPDNKTSLELEKRREEIREQKRKEAQEAKAKKQLEMKRRQKAEKD